jgi:uncharacterized protein YndB with AHSA1/START domain
VATCRGDQFVDADPARVWRTITEPALLARWWAPGDIAPRVGHRFQLDMPGWGAVPQGRGKVRNGSVDLLEQFVIMPR